MCKFSPSSQSFVDIQCLSPTNTSDWVIAVKLKQHTLTLHTPSHYTHPYTTHTLTWH